VKLQKLTRALVALILVPVMCIGLTGCGGEQEVSENGEIRTEEKVFVFARPEDIVGSLDCHDNYSISNGIVDRLIYDGLTSLDPEGRIVPGLATEWSTEDSKTWRFKLREGVKFHNGEDFDAESVRVTFERHLSNRQMKRSTDWTDLVAVRVIDPYTVELELSTPSAVVLGNLSRTWIVPAKAFTELGPEKFFEHPIGTGPFEFEYWKKGQEVSLKRFDGYWGEQGNVDRIIYKYIVGEATRVAGIQTGDIDMCDSISSENAAALANDPNVDVLKILAWDQILLGFKCDREPFNDARVREAVSLALDREAIVNYVMRGGRPAIGIVPKGVLGFDENLKPPARDVQRAKQLLAEAGYPDGLDTEIIAPDGWYPKSKEQIEAIQAQLAEANIRASVLILDGATYMERRNSGNYQIYWGGGAHSAADPNSQLQIRIENDGMASGYKNDELNAMIARARQLADPDERAALYKEIQRVMVENTAPVTYVFQLEEYVLVRKGVSGAFVRGDKGVDLRRASK